jgi:V8-like Glu-specific endopeptidase
MSNEVDSRDARWFLKRMPSQQVLDDVLQGDPVARLLGIAKDRAIANISLDPIAKTNADKDQVAAALKLATETAKRLAAGGEQIQLTDDERTALDLFVLLVARPAIFVQGGHVPERPENWPEVARDDEDLLRRMIAGVGRIETPFRFKCGTGFIVGKRRIVTNNHVLCALFGMPPNGWQKTPATYAQHCVEKTDLWSRDPKLGPIFELRGELNSTASSQARVIRILGHHLEVDMAVLELDTEPTDSRQLPLIAAEPSSFIERRIYAVGYPVDDARDSLGQRVTPVPIFQRVFGTDEETLGLKRFSPGLVIGWKDSNTFKHDASTLRGSSGSCIVDFEDRRVVGLHFGGGYGLKSNYAVPLWKFKDDPVLAKNGVEFD